MTPAAVLREQFGLSKEAVYDQHTVVWADVKVQIYLETKSSISRSF